MEAAERVKHGLVARIFVYTALGIEHLEWTEPFLNGIAKCILAGFETGQVGAMIVGDVRFCLGGSVYGFQVGRDGWLEWRWHNANG